MGRPDYLELRRGRAVERIPILYEDSSVLAIDKPAGWLLAPFHWQKTARNLRAAIESSLAARDFWARSRNLKFLCPVHRLDGETSGVLLFAKSPGAVKVYGNLFETRAVGKIYLAVVNGKPKQTEWTCHLKLAEAAGQEHKVKIDPQHGREAVTGFRVLQTREDAAGVVSLLEARPVTGRTHQIRVHLAEAGLPVVGDRLYGDRTEKVSAQLGLRAVMLSYHDPFRQQPVAIRAPADEFIHRFGFAASPVWTVA